MKFRRLAGVLIAAVILFSILPPAIAAATVGGADLGGYLFATDANGNILIRTLDDWNALADYVADGYDCEGMSFLMKDNIGDAYDPVVKPLGKQTSSSKDDRRRFAGTFDGGGYTLTVALDTSDTAVNWFQYNKGYCAPFAYTDNVVIKNLNVAGTVKTTGQWASGVVGSANGTCTLVNCRVDVSITSNTGNGSNGNHGGFIGIAEGNASITDCRFYGKLLGTNYKYSGGFIGINKATASITNCLFAPAEIGSGLNITGACEFVHNNEKDPAGSHVFDGAYYLTHFGETPQGVGLCTETEEDDEYDKITFDDVDYWKLVHSGAWEALQQALDECVNYGTVKLEQDIVAGAEDGPLYIRKVNGSDRACITLDINDHTLDRGLADNGIPKENGCVIIVQDMQADIINGTVTGGCCDGNGGGIRTNSGLSLSNVTVEGNTATGFGGGVFVSNPGTLIIEECTVRNNSSHKHGGGVYAYDWLIITDSSVSFNTTTENTDGQGGGVYIEKDGCLILNGVTVEGNHAQNAGGGIYIKNCNGGKIENCSIINNYAYASANGAGLYLYEGELTIKDTAITGNTGNKKNDKGVGVYVNSGTLNISGEVTVSGNLYKNNTPSNAYLNSGAVIAVADDITGSKIGVSMAVPGVFTSGLAGRGDGTEFFSDDTALDVYLNGDGEACLGNVPKFASHSLLLGGDIGVKFYMDLSCLDETAREGSYMTFTVQGKEYTAEFDGENMNPTGEYYGFTCRVNALQMAEDITAVFHYTVDGEALTVAAAEPYSVRTYIDSMLAKKEALSDETVALLVAIADYGAYAQYFLAEANGFTIGEDYAGMTPFTGPDELETQGYEINVYDYEIERNVGETGIEKITFSLDLLSATSIKVYFKPGPDWGDNSDFDEVTVSTDDHPLADDEWEQTVTETGRFLVTIKNIPAHRLGETFTIEAYKNRDRCVVVVSALSYVYAVLNAPGDSPLNTLDARRAAVALWNYYQATVNYMNSLDD